MSRFLYLLKDDICFRNGSVIFRVFLPNAPIVHPMMGNNKHVAYLRALQYTLFDNPDIDVIYSEVFLDKRTLNREYFKKKDMEHI